jgi:hypothetical protein
MAAIHNMDNADGQRKLFIKEILKTKTKKKEEKFI